MEATPLIATERLGRVLVVRMQREAKRNAVDPEMTAGLDAAMNVLEDDEELRVGVLTGTDAVFCAGTDLKQGAGPPTERGGHYGVIRRTRRKPLIAAVEGPAVGGGFELVLACDLVVASSAATFGLPEVTRGVYAAFGGLFRGPRALPLNIAREMVLTGEPLGARHAHAFGLVNHLTDPGHALGQALALAGRISQNAPLSVRVSMLVMEAAWAAQEEAGWRGSEEVRDTVATSADAAEGRLAFAERRTPVWVGR